MQADAANKAGAADAKAPIERSPHAKEARRVLLLLLPLLGGWCGCNSPASISTAAPRSVQPERPRIAPPLIQPSPLA